MSIELDGLRRFAEEEFKKAQEGEGDENEICWEDARWCLLNSIAASLLYLVVAKSREED